MPVPPLDLDPLRRLADAAREVLHLDSPPHPWLRRYAEDVPALLAEIDRLREQSQTLEHRLSDNSHLAGIYSLQAEAAQLRTTLAEKDEQIRRGHATLAETQRQLGSQNVALVQENERLREQLARQETTRG